MISATQKYLNALRHSHRSELQVIAYEGDTELGPLDFVSVTLTLDGTSDIQRSASIEVAVDPLQTVSRDTLESITTGSGKVVLKHGISFGGALIDPVITLATLRVEEMSQSLSGATRTLRCYDRTLLLQEHILPTARPLNDTYTNLIVTLIQETLPGEVVSIDPSIDTSLAPAQGKAFNRGDNRLRKIQELAEAAGGWLVCEPDGSFAIKPAPGSDAAESQATQWDFDQGDEGVLVDVESVFSRREQYNAVGIEFIPAEDDSTEDDWSAFIFLWDNDVTSPTYYDGDFGKRPLMFTEEYDHLPSVAEAETVARRKLLEHSGATRAISVTSIYNPLLLPGDKVSVVLPPPSGEIISPIETHFIERINLEFGSSATMDVATRLSRSAGSFGILLNGNRTGSAAGSLSLPTADATAANVTAWSATLAGGGPYGATGDASTITMSHFQPVTGRFFVLAGYIDNALSMTCDDPSYGFATVEDATNESSLFMAWKIADGSEGFATDFTISGTNPSEIEGWAGEWTGISSVDTVEGIGSNGPTTETSTDFGLVTDILSQSNVLSLGIAGGRNNPGVTSYDPAGWTQAHVGVDGAPVMSIAVAFAYHNGEIDNGTVNWAVGNQDDAMGLHVVLGVTAS